MKTYKIARLGIFSKRITWWDAKRCIWVVKKKATAYEDREYLYLTLRSLRQNFAVIPVEVK